MKALCASGLKRKTGKRFLSLDDMYRMYLPVGKRIGEKGVITGISIAKAWEELEQAKYVKCMASPDNVLYLSTLGAEWGVCYAFWLR